MVETTMAVYFTTTEILISIVNCVYSHFCWLKNSMINLLKIKICIFPRSFRKPCSPHEIYSRKMSSWMNGNRKTNYIRSPNIIVCTLWYVKQNFIENLTKMRPLHFGKGLQTHLHSVFSNDYGSVSNKWTVNKKTLFHPHMNFCLCICISLGCFHKISIN